MSLLLLKPELDIWTPGEHNGTFRGNQLAFVAAKAALEFRDRTELEAQVKQKEEFVRSFLDQEIKPLHPSIAIRGLGLIWGIDVSGFMDEAGAKRVTDISFDNGLIIERAWQRRLCAEDHASADRLDGASGCRLRHYQVQYAAGDLSGDQGFASYDLSLAKPMAAPGKRHESAFRRACGLDVKVALSPQWKTFSSCYLR